jgi:phage virion morphogenesis protein
MQIIIDDSALQQKLEDAADKLADTTQLMQRISMTLLNVTEENFNAEGRPKWAGLSTAYAAKRKAGKILQVSGQLAGSLTAFHGADHAGVGSNKVYAAIHQFGGMAGRGHKVKIKARPYLPMDSNGNLQQEAYVEVAETIDLYLKSIL